MRSVRTFVGAVVVVVGVALAACSSSSEAGGAIDWSPWSSHA